MEGAYFGNFFDRIPGDISQGRRNDTYTSSKKSTDLSLWKISIIA